MAKEFTAVVPITAKGYRSAAWLYFFAKNRYIAAAYAVGSIGSGLNYNSSSVFALSGESTRIRRPPESSTGSVLAETWLTLPVRRLQIS